MKKFIAIPLILSAFISLASCKNSEPDINRISQIRENLFFYETEDFTLYAYPEIKENPFLADGFVGEKENIMSFKITYPVGKTPSAAPILEFFIENDGYKVKFAYSPFASASQAEIKISSLPDSNFFGNITFGEEKREIEFISLKGKNLISYKDAIVLSLSTNNETAKDFLSASGEYEIRVRLLENDGYNYWFVGLIGEKNGVALLIDAETGEIIDVKKTE